MIMMNRKKELCWRIEYFLLAYNPTRILSTRPEPASPGSDPSPHLGQPAPSRHRTPYFISDWADKVSKKIWESAKNKNRTLTRDGSLVMELRILADYIKEWCSKRLDEVRNTLASLEDEERTTTGSEVEPMRDREDPQPGSRRTHSSDRPARPAEMIVTLEGVRSTVNQAAVLVEKNNAVMDGWIQDVEDALAAAARSGEDVATRRAAEKQAVVRAKLDAGVRMLEKHSARRGGTLNSDFAANAKRARSCTHELETAMSELRIAELADMFDRLVIEDRDRGGRASRRTF